MLLYTYILHIGTNTGIFRPYVMNFYRTTHMFIEAQKSLRSSTALT